MALARSEDTSTDRPIGEQQDEVSVIAAIPSATIYEPEVKIPDPENYEVSFAGEIGA